MHIDEGKRKAPGSAKFGADRRQGDFTMSEVVNQRTRNWTFVIYPGDSAPDNWLEILKSLNVSGFVSPLHMDINPDDTENKPHRHVLLMFEGKKSFNQVNAICESLNAPHPQYVQSKSGMARYLCHMDNPEKKQYLPEDVICLGGADYMNTVATASDLDRTISEMEQWCDDNGVFSYAALSRYARMFRPDWARVLRYRCTVHMKAYLQSCQWELREDIHYKYTSSHVSRDNVQ